jgi:hypothetical protein
MRDKDGSQFESRYSAPGHLALHTLACINEKILLVDIHNLRRGVPRRSWFGRRITEYGNSDRHYLLNK